MGAGGQLVILTRLKRGAYSMTNLAEKVAIIVGAAAPGNLGQGLARRFARAGDKVVVAGRHEAALERLAGDIGGAHCLCDLEKKQDIDALVAFTRERFGHVDIGINCVGWGLMKGFDETTEEDLHRMMN